MWSPENKRLLCSLIITEGQNIDEIKKYEPFTELSTQQIEQQISSIVMQLHIGELRNKKYNIYALSKWNSGMIGLLRALKVPGTIDASTGRLLVFPNHEGGFDKHPKYRKNLEARKKFIATFMKPNKFLTAVSKKHLASYLEELRKR